MELKGQQTMSLRRDKNGHRDYRIKYYIIAEEEDINEAGPQTALQTEGLPTPGSSWTIGSDDDVWAYCQLEASVDQVIPNESFDWTVEMVFTTRGPDRCNDEEFTNPLLESPRITIGFTKFTKEATNDRFGIPITNSAFERVRGHQIEFDDNRPTIKIRINVGPLDLYLVSSMVDTVNDSVLWGFNPRCVKLSHVGCEQKFYGLCQVYYEMTLDFEINFDTWDKDLPDECSQVLNGLWNPETNHWTLVPDSLGNYPDSNDPSNFIVFGDKRFNPKRGLMDGFGEPAGVVIETEATATTAGASTMQVTTPCCPENLLANTMTMTITDDSPLAGTYTLNFNALDPGGGSGWGYFGSLGSYTPDTGAGPTFLLQCYGIDARAQFWLVLPQGSIPQDDTTCGGFSITFSNIPLASFGGTDSASCVITGAQTDISSAPFNGTPYVGAKATIHVEQYPESNFLLLGVPATLDGIV